MRVIVLGAGIKGSAIAGLLSSMDGISVCLVERDAVAAGATSTNHGRVHSGTWNYFENKRTIVERNQESLRLLSMLPGVVNQQHRGHYLIESETSIAPFVQFCEQNKISISRCDTVSGYKGWVDSGRYSADFIIPEFTFNPAAVAQVFVQYAVRSCHFELIKSSASTIERVGSNLLVQCDNGNEIEGDIVINALGRWAPTLRSNLTQLPLQDTEITWERWRLLCLKLDQIANPLLRGPLTIECKTAESLAVIPHEGWLIFGCDTKREVLLGPEDQPIVDQWRPFSTDNESDREIISALSKHFFKLEAVRTNSINSLFTFSGVHASVRKQSNFSSLPVPYAHMKVQISNNAPGYYLAFGGSATTSILDAADVVRRIANDCGLRLRPVGELMREISHTEFKARIAARRMIWQEAS